MGHIVFQKVIVLKMDLLIQIEIVKVFSFFYLFHDSIFIFISKECEATCLKCFGPNESQCLSCSYQKFLLNGECLNECPIGYFSNSISNTCQGIFLSFLVLFFFLFLKKSQNNNNQSM